MRRRLFIFLSAIPFLIFDLAVMPRFFFGQDILLFPALLLLYSAKFSLESSLILAFTYGFIYDISSLSNRSYITLILIIEVIVVNFLQKKFIDFNNMIVALISVSILAFVFRLIHSGFLSELFYFRLNLKELLVSEFAALSVPIFWRLFLMNFFRFSKP